MKCEDPNLPLTPVRLMRPGIGWNVSCGQWMTFHKVFTDPPFQGDCLWIPDVYRSHPLTEVLHYSTLNIGNVIEMCSGKGSICTPKTATYGSGPIPRPQEQSQFQYIMHRKRPGNEATQNKSSPSCVYPLSSLKTLLHVARSSRPFSPCEYWTKSLEMGCNYVLAT